MSVTQDQIDELRERLSDVDTTTAPDTMLERCLNVSAEALDHRVPTYNRVMYGYVESVLCIAVQVYENRARGRVGVDPAGEFDTQYIPGPTQGMVDSTKGYWGPLEDVAGQLA